MEYRTQNSYQRHSTVICLSIPIESTMNDAWEKKIGIKHRIDFFLCFLYIYFEIKSVLFISRKLYLDWFRRKKKIRFFYTLFVCFENINITMFCSVALDTQISVCAPTKPTKHINSSYPFHVVGENLISNYLSNNKK